MLYSKVVTYLTVVRRARSSRTYVLMARYGTVHLRASTLDQQGSTADRVPQKNRATFMMTTFF